ncbi:YpoC family protein [Paenisporosarcina indica]|uniref:YpoC family protein n=1 Tax=Paenisporosarcina indica TaxID=650093 RepID=UPI00094F89D1|nr:hypothetical protein [Paenisporosarcina indica]
MIQFDPKRALKAQVDDIVSAWIPLRQSILDSHKQRKKESKNDMMIGIKLYEKLIILASETSIFDVHKIKDYEVLPLNGEERYLFIIRKPDHYAAFCQLDELFEETQKKIAGLRTRK